LQQARRGAGLSQAKLAKKMEVSLNTVCSWEQGWRNPNQDHLERLVKYLGVDYNFLLERK